MKKFAIVVKYFPTSQRYSGITSMLEVLVRHLENQLELHIFSHCSSIVANQWNNTRRSTLHAISDFGFWWGVGTAVKNISPTSTLIVSGIHKSHLFYPVFLPLIKKLQHTGNLIFLQSVNMDMNLGKLSNNLLSNTNYVLASNPKLAKKLSATTNRKVCFFPPCIDSKNIQHSESSFKTKKFRVGFFNHINWTKGADIAIQSFNENNREDTEYLVAGQGRLKQKLHKKFSMNPNIKFLDYLQNPLPDITACDIMVLPFRTSTSVLGISQTVLECMQAGVVIIGTNHDTITSVIKHKINGLIIQDKKEISSQINRLLDDIVFRKHLIDNAKITSARYDVANVAKQLLNLIGQ